MSNNFNKYTNRVFVILGIFMASFAFSAYERLFVINFYSHQLNSVLVMTAIGGSIISGIYLFIIWIIKRKTIAVDVTTYKETVSKNLNLPGKSKSE